MKIPFGGRILILGCGAVSRCFQPLVLRHIEMDFTQLTVMDFEDLRSACAEMTAAGGHFVQDYVTTHNYATLLSKHLGPGDILIDLAWNIETLSLMRWCHDHHVGYINTSVELWDPYSGAADMPPTERTLYVRHMALRKQAACWSKPWSTFIVEHGANPGLVSHWVKVGLADIAQAILRRRTRREREDLLEQYLADADYPRLAMLTGTKVIHISP